MSDEQLNNVVCNDCGITFGFSARVEKMWRRSHKTFYCPNGHALVWKEETATQKELNELRAKVTELEAQLSAIKLEKSNLDTKMQELQSELEIWKPVSSKEPAA